MNSKKYNKEELYPEDISCDERLQFHMYLEQAKTIFPKIANDEWLIIIKGIFAFMRIKKKGSYAVLKRN